MWASEAALRANLDDLAIYVDHLARRQRGALERAFEYNSVVISLYGFLERFVDDVIREHIGKLTVTVERYADLPGPLVAGHAERCSALIGKLYMQHLRALSPRTIIGNLHSCLSQGEGAAYAIDPEVFTQFGGGNLRADIIEQTLLGVGVEGAAQLIQSDSSFQASCQEEYERCGIRFDPRRNIAELVERRNDVAHGSASQLLSNEILMSDYATAVRIYCCGVCGILDDAIRELRFRYQSRPPGTLVGVFNHRIACFELDSPQSLAVGDWLLARTGAGEVREGPVLEIQIEGASFHRVTAKARLKVALRVDFYVHVTYTFGVVPKGRLGMT